MDYTAREPRARKSQDQCCLKPVGENETPPDGWCPGLMENKCQCCLDCPVFNLLWNLMKLTQKVTFKYIPAQTKDYEHHESVPSCITLYLTLVMCLIAVAKHPKRSNKQEEGLMLAQSL